MNDVSRYYDALIDENNDPVHDPKPLKEYMEKWDGSRFLESMNLDKNKTVLEIGIGTGRIAMKTAPLCKCLYGIDISEKTIQRASDHLSAYRNIKLICGDFMTYEFNEQFDVIYASLTFMHIEDKKTAIQKVSSLLHDTGLFVLSIDKNQDRFIDMGTRKIKVYPDNPTDICSCILNADLRPVNQFEVDHAYIMVSKKGSL